jgi:hypothetical protein
MPEPETVAERERVVQFAGVGCAIQGLGILAPFVLSAFAGTIGAAIGVLLLIVLLFVGGAKASTWRCGNCKNPIAEADVRLCPVCKARLG